MKDGRRSIPFCSGLCFCHVEFFSGEKLVKNN